MTNTYKREFAITKDGTIMKITNAFNNHLFVSLGILKNGEIAKENNNITTIISAEGNISYIDLSNLTMVKHKDSCKGFAENLADLKCFNE